MVNKRVKDVDQFAYCTVLGAVQGTTLGGIILLILGPFVHDDSNRYLILALGALAYSAGIIMWWKQNHLRFTPFYKNCTHNPKCIYPNREWCEFHQRITNKLD